MKTRKQIRLKDYDYSKDGIYFITIGTNGRQNTFGRIENNQTILNDAGNMIDFWRSEIPICFYGVRLDQHIIMPNHIHAIINIVGADQCVRPLHNNSPPIPNDDIRMSSKMGENRETMGHQMSGHGPIGNCGRTHRSAPTVSGMMQWFKTMSTNNYIRNVKTTAGRHSTNVFGNDRSTIISFATNAL